MNEKRLNLLKELTQANGVSGCEQEVRDILKGHLKGFAEVTQDNIGSIIFKKEGTSKNPKIMIAGHMDEIGFMVRSITDDGFIRFLPLGGWFEQVILAHRVIIKSTKGNIIGIVGSKPLHILTEEERKRPPKIKDMFIDVGAFSKKEAEDFGIKPGDPVIPVSEFTEMKNKNNLLSKAWDDRLGCAMFVEVIKELQKEKHPNTVYGVGTVQEETGLRGAKTSSWVVNPDAAIIAEDGVANDTPGTNPDDVSGRLRKGPRVVVYDRSMIPNIKLRDLVVEVAKKNRIPFQYSYSEGGGTDGGMIHIHGRGVPCIYIGVPARYIHTHTGIINKDDFDNTLRLMVALVKVLDENEVKKITL